jgi:eukaryotic-like serine/threonine-protein kinase
MPPFDPQALVGRTLDGRYLLSAHLATGGMGAVFRAQHVYMRKDVAIKVLRPDLSAAAEIVERFRRESEIAAGLEHENIVRVSDFGRSPEGYLFLVMELLDGESLFDRLRREGFLAPEEAVPILWQICAGLEAAHVRGVVHRDLKPENVFLARTASGREIAKILDFGIAKIADPGTAICTTQAGMVVGTPEYLSPEQATGSDVDARADLYGVGIIAWRMLVGRHPFKAADARALLMMQATQPVAPISDPRPELSAWPGLVAAVARACEKDVARRHQSAGALKADIAASLPGFVPPAGTTPAPGRGPALTPGPGRGPAGILGRAAFELAPPGTPAGSTESLTPPLRPSWSLQRQMQMARLRIAALDAARRGAAVAGAVLGWTVAHARARPVPFAAGVAAVALAMAIAGTAAWGRGRAAAEARSLLAAGRPADARSVLQTALSRRPGSGELLLLLGRALHAGGDAAGGIDAYAAALAQGPLDDAALTDLAQDLGRERSIADRAGHLLVRTGERALPAIASATREGPGVQRLRSLTLARDLGLEERLERVASYSALLADPDCEVRRAAARRLGEIGSPEALPALRDLAGARRETKGLFGIVRREPTCAAAEAVEAARRIDAGRRR